MHETSTKALRGQYFRRESMVAEDLTCCTDKEAEKIFHKAKPYTKEYVTLLDTAEGSTELLWIVFRNRDSPYTNDDENLPRPGTILWICRRARRPTQGFR